MTKQRWDAVVVELTHHLPYTVVSSFMAMLGVWYFGVTQMGRMPRVPFSARFTLVICPVSYLIFLVATRADIQRR